MTAANLTASRRQLIVVLGMLSTFGPISLDLYLPALPQLAEELQANIARAVARDLCSGRELVVFLSRLILISGLAR